MLAGLAASCALLGACGASLEHEVATVAASEAAGAPAVAAGGEAFDSRWERPQASQGAAPLPAPTGMAPLPIPAPRTVAARKQEQARPVGFTPGETRYMETEAKIAGAQLIDEMKGDRWEETVARFEADAMADQDAGELQRVYEQALRETLATHGLGLARFGCGFTLCAGTILGPLEDGEARYEAWQGQGIGLSTPFFVRYEADNAVQFELRFTFSTDPSARSITISH